MYEYDLSICLAAIRKQNWSRLYNSIIESIGNYSFEIIFCGPHEEPPEELKNLPNVKCILDYGAPTRAQQIACIAARGEYLAWTADDGWFLPNKLKECLDIIKANPSSRKAMVTHYKEDIKDGLASYSCNFHEPARSPYFPDSYVVFNSAIVQTDHFKEIGGFDCRFEVCPMAFVDYGIRSHRDGIEVIMNDDIIFECTHFPGRTGDHAPIHDGQTQHDMPLYKKIYLNPNCVGRIHIDLENWASEPSRWIRRFGNG